MPRKSARRLSTQTLSKYISFRDSRPGVWSTTADPSSVFTRTQRRRGGAGFQRTGAEKDPSYACIPGIVCTCTRDVVSILLFRRSALAVIRRCLGLWELGGRGCLALAVAQSIPPTCRTQDNSGQFQVPVSAAVGTPFLFSWLLALKLLGVRRLAVGVPPRLLAPESRTTPRARTCFASSA